MNDVVDSTAWQSARKALLAEEKEATKALDRVAALRRRMPWQRIDKPYRFVGRDGPMTLADLFEGRTQLIVYHHMLRPDDPAPCPGCALVGDQIPHLAHLNARDTSFTFVSKAPWPEIEAFRQRMGWQMPWVETVDDFGMDLNGQERGTAINVFIRQGGEVFRSYFSTGRGLESFSVWALLDMTPFGRQETWQDAPDGTPQGEPYRWWRLHDEYGGSAGTRMAS